MDKVRFAVIGCGRIARRHVPILNNLKDAELVAVCDVVPEKAKKWAEDYDVNWYTDYKEMFEKENIDAVNILIPSGLHPELAIQCLRMKKHVIVEKPMALALEDADRMISEAYKNDVRLFVIKQNRFNYPVVKLREALEQGRFGKLVMGTIRVRWSRDQEYYDQDAWRGTWAMDGGVFTNQASHHVDLLEWMMGDVISVQCMTKTQLVDIEVEDTGVAILEFANGALGIIEATTATRPKDLEGSISILGEKGTVEIGGFAVNEMKVWNFVDKMPGDDEVLSKYKVNPPDVYGYGHSEYLKHVVDSIKTGKNTDVVEGLEGRRSLELINALYESAETGKKVFLKFKANKSRLGKKI